MALRTGRPVFFPLATCAAPVPEARNQVRLVILLERGLFQQHEPNFQGMRSGPEFTAMSAALNAILTAASMRAEGLGVWWETVYSDALPDWEQCNPKTPPEDVRSAKNRYTCGSSPHHSQEHCIGFRLHIVILGGRRMLSRSLILFPAGGRDAPHWGLHRRPGWCAPAAHVRCPRRLTPKQRSFQRHLFRLGPGATRAPRYPGRWRLRPLTECGSSASSRRGRCRTLRKRTSWPSSSARVALKSEPHFVRTEVLV